MCPIDVVHVVAHEIYGPLTLAKFVSMETAIFSGSLTNPHEHDLLFP